MKKYIDLHCHSVYSDGDKTPAQLVQKAADLSMEYMALSDHDTLGGVLETKKLGKEKGIHVFSAAEFSCFDKKDTHILGYCMNPLDDELNSTLNNLRIRRKERAVATVEKLKEDGFKITLEEVMQYSTNESIGRPHIASVLVKNGQKFLGSKCKYYVPYEKLTIKGCVDMIKKAGGIAVIAHPKLLRYNNNDMEKLIVAYKELGMGGIEVYYPYHYKSEVDFYTRMCKVYNMVATVGGDYHNDYDFTKNNFGYVKDLPMIEDTLKLLKELEK